MFNFSQFIILFIYTHDFSPQFCRLKSGTYPLYPLVIHTCPPSKGGLRRFYNLSPHKPRLKYLMSGLECAIAKAVADETQTKYDYFETRPTKPW